MKDTLEEAKSALAKAKDDMAQYYNHRRSPAPTFSPGDMVYLESEDIQTTCLSRKLSDRRLGPYPVERHVGKYAYRLTHPPPMRCLHPVFNVVKLTPAPDDPIIGRHQNPPPPPELIDGEEEYIVEKVLNSRLFRRKLQYLVKWEGYGVEGNTWEYSENLNHALEKVTEFHTRNPGAPRCIRTLAFGSIPFHPISLSQVSSCCLSRGGVIVRGTPLRQTTSAPLPLLLPLRLWLPLSLLPPETCIPPAGPFCHSPSLLASPFILFFILI